MSDHQGWGRAGQGGAGRGRGGTGAQQDIERALRPLSLYQGSATHRCSGCVLYGKIFHMEHVTSVMPLFCTCGQLSFFLNEFCGGQSGRWGVGPS